MSRYFFDLHNGDGLLSDTVGMELASKTSVTLQIARILTDVAGDELPVQDRSVIGLRVRDEQGRTVCVSSLTFNTEWLE